MNGSDETTESHVDGSGEEGRAKEKENIGKDVGTHSGSVIVCYAATDIADELNCERSEGVGE